MKRETLIILGIIACLVIWPFLIGDYAVSRTNRAMIYALMALSFSVLAGRLGWFSLCQTTLAGVSAYVVAILGAQQGLPYAVVIPSAILTSVAFAAVFGVLTVRAKAVSFLMLTLALGQMVWALAFQWVGLTGGYNGISGVRLPMVLGFNLNDPRIFYVILAACTLAIFLVVHRFYKSRFGLLLLGIQENEQRMRSLGHPVYLARFTAFVLAGAIAGVAGVFLVYDMGIMTPSPLSLNQAVLVLTAAVLGGYRTIWGPALGAAILITLQTGVSQYTDRHMMVIGAVLALCILLMPRGLSEFPWKSLVRGRKTSTASST